MARTALNFRFVSEVVRARVCVCVCCPCEEKLPDENYSYTGRGYFSFLIRACVCLCMRVYDFYTVVMFLSCYFIPLQFHFNENPSMVQTK